LPQTLTRRLIKQKARHHPRRGSDTLSAHGFRIYFTPLTAVLFTFPSRYLFTIGRQRVFSLTPWSAWIHAAFHVCRVTQELPRGTRTFGYGSLTLYGAVFHPLHLAVVLSHRGPTTPGENPRFGLFRFRSPLLTESILFLFLRLLRCFTSPGVACPLLFDSEREMGGLAPMGYPIRKSPGQSVCAAFRGLSQLSASFIACWHQGIHYVPALP
jgi:hypothetical protein